MNCTVGSLTLLWKRLPKPPYSLFWINMTSSARIWRESCRPSHCCVSMRSACCTTWKCLHQQMSRTSCLAWRRSDVYKTKWKGRQKIKKKWTAFSLFYFQIRLFWSFLECIVFAFRLLTQSRAQRANAVQELRDREEVEKELSVVKAWIQETRELLLNPTQDIDSLLQELEVYISHHGNIIC